VSVPLKLLMPLRVPELAPSLGRVIVPRRRAAPWVQVDDVREELATRILELAGEGRAAAGREDRAVVLEVTGRRAWTAAWDLAVRRAAARVADALDAEIRRTAEQVRLPRRRLRRQILAGAEKRAIAARLGTGGAAFVAALDELEAAADVARRLEAAWLALEGEVEAERRRWAPELEALGRWRPALWPLVLLWAPVAALLLWFGLVLGGYLPAPAWLAARLGF